MRSGPSADARFRQVFHEHRDQVWKYCYRRLGPDEVPDAVADVFLVAWRRVDQIPEGDEALLWLYGVARNVVRNTGRSLRRRRRLSEKVASLAQPDVPGPETVVVRNADDERLAAAVSGLKPIERELLRLRAWEGLSHAEIAQVVDLSLRGVESRLARVRKRLASALSQPTPTPQFSPRPIEEGGER